MIKFWIHSDKIRNRIFLPKYYNPEIASRLATLSKSHETARIRDLVTCGVLSVSSGHEVGKAAYGTGDIPFVRTSDIVNWEIKAAPKQGVSREIYEELAEEQDVQEGDILFVRDGTYLIGTNCFITRFDKELLYQSHLLKLRVNDPESMDPKLLFLALNGETCQLQFRSFQFTADIIDTIGQRFLETILPFPKDTRHRRFLSAAVEAALKIRMRGKAFIRHCPVLLEEVLRTGSPTAISDFSSATDDEIEQVLHAETISSEFGGFEHFWLYSDEVREMILVPKYYDPSIRDELNKLGSFCDLRSFHELRRSKIVEYTTGDEVGKMAYGTGKIAFIRTTDFANWEIDHDPKQNVSRAVYDEYSEGQDVRANDILLVRDGTYLVGSSCIITEADSRSLYSAGLFKIRALATDVIDPFLLLGLLNSWIVKRQIRSKQFTRDVIDTIGNRLDEVVLPIPKDSDVRRAISDAVATVVQTRIAARAEIIKLVSDFERQ